MKKIILILIILLIALPSFGYKKTKRIVPHQHYYPNARHNNYNYPYGYYNSSRSYRFSPIRKIKNYFLGTPTGWTNTPYYNDNNEFIRNFFNDNGSNTYHYNNGGYYTQNREVTGGGTVTIIND